MGGNIPGGNFLGGNFPAGGGFSRGEFDRWEFSPGGIFLEPQNRSQDQKRKFTSY